MSYKYVMTVSEYIDEQGDNAEMPVSILAYHKAVKRFYKSVGCHDLAQRTKKYQVSDDGIKWKWVIMLDDQTTDEQMETAEELGGQLGKYLREWAQKEPDY